MSIVVLGCSIWCHGQADDRSEPPNASAQKKIEADLRSMYGAQERAARTPAARAALARRYLKAGLDMTDDPAARYVLLEDARQQALAGADAVIAAQATERLTQEYRVDGARLTLATFNRFPPSSYAKSDECLLFLESSLSKAEGDDQFDAAEQLATLIDNATRMRTGTLLAREAQSMHNRLRELAKAYGDVSEQIRRVKAATADDKAASEAGAFYCLDAGDWSRGLPLLARGTDQLAALARTELSAKGDANKLASAADGWWDWSATAGGPHRRSARQHAVVLYRAAYPDLHGLARAKTESRLADASHDRNPTLGFLPIGLSIYYSFEPDAIHRLGVQEAATNLAGNGTPGVLQDVRILQDGAVGACASFNGITSSIECGDTAASRLTGPFSLSVFVRIRSATTGPLISRDWWDPPKGYTLRLDEARPDITIGVGQWRNVTAEVPLLPGPWHHVAATYDGAKLRLFVDGSPAGEAVVNAGVVLAPAPLVIGNDPKDRSRRLNGNIDEPMIFDRPLEPWEIRLLASRSPEAKVQ